MVDTVKHATIESNKNNICPILMWNLVRQLIRSEVAFGTLIIILPVSYKPVTIEDGHQGCFHLEEIDEEDQDAALGVIDLRVIQERKRNVVEEATQADAKQEREARFRKVFLLHRISLYGL